jgi:hypothetical protein
MTAGKPLVLCFLLITCWATSSQAQRNKNQLQKEKQQNLDKIKET